MTLRFMSRGEIAQYLGVSLTTVKKGYATFPEPDVQVGRNKGWSKNTIDTWLVSRGKTPA